MSAVLAAMLRTRSRLRKVGIVIVHQLIVITVGKLVGEAVMLVGLRNLVVRRFALYRPLVFVAVGMYVLFGFRHNASWDGWLLVALA
jgi:hypothetical protein